MYALEQQRKLPHTSLSITRAATDWQAHSPFGRRASWDFSGQEVNRSVGVATPANATPAPSPHFMHSFADIPVFSPAVTRAINSGGAGGVTEVVRASAQKASCGCPGTCVTCGSRNPRGRHIGERSTQNPAGGGAPAPAPGGGGAVAPAAPARRAELQSGPRYTPRGTIAPVIAGGLKSAGPWDMDAQFRIDNANGIFAGCGEIHQDIKWDAAAAASFTALFGTDVPHGGFPAGHPSNVWIEDRDQANTRYGRRRGPMSAPVAGSDEYTNAAGVQDMLHGAIYHGNDNPSNWPVALAGRWTFMLLAFDMCNGGVQVGNADFIRIDW
jgi:hypothetical protein